eukprot:CCRYP_016702-RF/>CCRYP_016702-RF protein AED:0.48 eAED:0.48 QI:0/-1/0/1/-1/0/1/0/30
MGTDGFGIECVGGASTRLNGLIVGRRRVWR